MGGRRLIVALGAAVLALSGCAAQEAGQAAVSDVFSVSQAQVDSEVRAVLEQTGQAPGDPPEGLALATAQRLVTDALFLAAADELGVEVTPAQVEDAREDFAGSYGGDEALVEAAGQAGIPAESLDDFIRSTVLFTAISEQVAPGADGGTQQEAGRLELARYSEQIDVRTAPRYGTWDAESLQIVPGSEVVGPAPLTAGTE